ncbi:MAG: DMT family transporter [Actinobacteria bacterium]|nr:DMT family transporter [Actinomycetota bacterium]
MLDAFVARFAPAIFVLLWSSGFVGAKFLLPHAEPFTLLTVRFAITATILLSLAAVTRSPMKMNKSQYLRAGYISLFLHFAYTGGIFVAIHEGVSAGITAVIVSLQPVLVSLLAIPLLGEHLRASQVAGLALGLTGVTLLLVPKILQGNTSLAFSTIGVLAAGFALVGSVWGTLEQKRYGSDLPILYGLAFQYTVSGVLLAILAVTTESLVIEWSMQFVAVLLWIVLGVSIGSVIMLFYLLRRGSAGSVSSLLYLGTPLAATFGYIFFDEHISSVGAIGMAIAVFGVWLVLRQEKVKA